MRNLAEKMEFISEWFILLFIIFGMPIILIILSIILIIKAIQIINIGLIVFGSICCVIGFLYLIVMIQAIIEGSKKNRK